jgi:hypothetical protein
MTGYLQRLLGRGEGVPAASAFASAPTEVRPAALPASPVMGFDQRLAAPGLAEDYGILGLPPGDMDPGGDEFAGDGTLLPEPVVQTPGASVLAGDPASRPEPGQAYWAEAAPLPLREAPMATPKSSPAPEPDRISPSPAPRMTAPVLRQASPAPATRTAPQGQAAPSPAPPIAPTAAPLALPCRPPSPRSEASPTPVFPLRAAAPAAMPAQAFVETQSPVVQPLTPSERPAIVPTSEIVPPPPSPPPPLPAPSPASVMPVEVDRLVREAVRAELARDRVENPAAHSPSPPAPVDGTPGDAPAPRRPATAREASVIGDLEPSGRPLTLFGLRRR